MDAAAGGDAAVGGNGDRFFAGKIGACDRGAATSYGVGRALGYELRWRNGVLGEESGTIGAPLDGEGYLTFDLLACPGRYELNLIGGAGRQTRIPVLVGEDKTTTLSASPP